MKVFAKKATALKYLKTSQILCNEDIKKYFILKDFSQFQELIQQHTNPSFYEFILGNNSVNLFLDIEIYQSKHPNEYNDSDNIIIGIIQTIKDYLKGCNSSFVFKTIILESHELIDDHNLKKSYHIIIRIFDTVDHVCGQGHVGGQGNETPVHFKNVKILKEIIKKLFPSLSQKKIIDLSVYREGLFRTYLSTKNGEHRPLVQSHLSDNFEFVETFVSYISNNSTELNLPCQDIHFIDNDDIEVINNDDIEVIEPIQKNLTSSDIKIIQQFVRKNYKSKLRDIRDIVIDRNLNCIIIALNDTYCYNIDREHKSNHQYIVIDTYSSKQKCHDIDCKDYKHDEIKIVSFPKEINEIILKCLKVNKQEFELIEKAIVDCKEYITTNFDENIEEIKFDKHEMVFRGNVSNLNMIKLNGKCSNCQIEHQISNTGYCLKCTICQSIFPKNQLIPVDDKYKHLNAFWMNYHQLINNGTVNININNFYNGEEEFSCDVQLDDCIFKNKETTKLYNQVLDGHKVIKISELLHKLEIDFKYTNGWWYYFNGSIWKQDKESLELRKRIVKLSNQFNIIKTHYETNGGDIIVKNIKSLINKLYKPGFEEEVIKGSKMYYNDESFINNLNSKKHLVPFTNGVFDLLENKFRDTKKEDYINLTTNYNYSENTNQEVYTFLEQVLPNKGVHDYVLKKMSECLNGDIPNTHFLMFIGDSGANGKSQLLNLMKLAMGEFGEKVEVTLLTRKRNNANEANSEKIKLMHKRFAFLSEPEDGEKINIGLLKELTGSEEIVARGLYQEAVSFVLEAKLFLACNELPEIKGEDTALWRRIRVIDFPSRFIDDPVEPGEYKIDRTLPSRMREDLSWRQTFMKILLEYYYKDVKEPIEINIKTNEYRQENNDFYNWLEENVKYKENEVLQLKEVCQIYLGKNKVHSSFSSKYKKEIEKYIKEKYKNVKWQFDAMWINDKSIRGWKNLTIKDD
jgi:P4 family phage/plasmid primase-like protien